MFRNLKVPQKLVLVLMSISLVPLVASGVINYRLTKSALEQKTINALQAVTNSRASHINHSIQLRQEQAKEFAGAYLPRQMNETGLNAPELIQGIQNDIDSRFYYLNLTPTGHYRDIDKKTDIKIIGVWDVHGNIVANTNHKFIGKKMPLDYIQKVYEYGTYFGGLEKDPLTAENDLILLEEIRNWESGMIVGAVSLEIEAKVLDDITSAREGLGESGETYVVDNKYRMITNSRFVKDSILKVRVNTEGVRACFQKYKAPVIYKNYLDKEVVGVVKSLPDQGWCLISEVDAAEAFAPVRAFRNRMLFTGGILVVLILFAAYGASRSLTRPLLRLNQASQKVARGEYDIDLKVEGRDEIGQLTQTFNKMAKNLADITAQLEEKNKALFKHLAILASQKKELREVNQELDRFVYTASHDLRAPLRGIASFATFLEEDYKQKLDATGKDYLEEIRKGATKMNALIEDLLTLSRISRIKNPYEMVDVRKLIDSVLDRIKFDIQQNRVEIVLPDQLPNICCDRIKMAEVFLNLVNNAIKFSSKEPQGDHPRVEIGYTAQGIDHVFFVKDNGIGIDPKYHEQIFGIFKRLHTDKEYEGTGAGLSIMKRIIDDHGGKVWIESQLGQGAKFCFTIPRDLKVGETQAGDPNA